jgi:DNA (cytosine-5)-methyltransferase 1
MVNVLKEKKPRFFIAENVKGILSANNKQALPMIVKEFELAGYYVKYKHFECC